MTQIAKLIVRGVLGFVVGILAGALIGALGFALLILITGGGNRSFGGIGIITKPFQFAAFMGAIVGSFYGAIVGVIIGLAGLAPVRGGVAGLVVGAVIAAYLFFSASDPSLDSVLLWIFITGGILGTVIAFLSMLIQKRITWLSS